MWKIIHQHLAHTLRTIVKNRFSNLTKEQIVWDQCRKEVMNDCQLKALKEGCLERAWAWTGVPPTEETNTK